MPKRAIEFINGCYYHVYNRGFDRNPIFYNPSDYLFALDLIQKYFKEYFISIIAYCLMPNHYHFLLRQDGDLPLCEAIRDTFNTYVQGLNKKAKRHGALFQGRFNAIMINDEEYLIHLCRYIHRNPIDSFKPLVGRLEDWAYSNYPEWIGRRNGKLVDRNFVKGCFANGAEYEAFVMETPSAKVIDRMGKYLFDE
jgi:putative transposase